MSSAWWLGQNAMLGLAASSRTTQNLLRTGEAVLNLASADLVDHVDRLALLTGSPDLSPHKRETGYHYEPRKFEAAGLTREPSDLVGPDRVAECPIQLECRVSGHYPIRTSSLAAHAIHAEVLRAHVADAVRLPGSDHIDPRAWEPLIMKFCDFFGDGRPLIPSRLAAGWQMPGRLEETTRAWSVTSHSPDATR
jgi:flavin reductase (DIM6/NTAB) family NADH-FMN oxidoreductase RutF